MSRASVLTATAVIASVFAIALVPIKGSMLSAVELRSIRAGALYYCATCITGTGACNDCLSDGNGRYVKCSTTMPNMTYVTDYNDPTFPSPTCDINTVNCGGVADYFYNRDANGICVNYWKTTTCFRTFTSGTSGTASVNCDLE